MKKSKFILFLIITMLIVIFPLIVNAATSDVDAQVNPEGYHSSGPSTDDVKEMYKFGGKVAGAIQIGGTIVSVGALMVIAIRYMLSSADEKAEYKERLFPYIIGAVLLFGASNLVKIAYNIFG